MRYLIEDLIETVIQVVLLYSRLDNCPKKRLVTSGKLLVVVKSRLLKRLLLERMVNSCWELLSKEGGGGRDGSCYSGLGLREESTRLLCRGSRHQGRSRGPWSLV